MDTFVTGMDQMTWPGALRSLNYRLEYISMGTVLKDALTEASSLWRAQSLHNRSGGFTVTPFRSTDTKLGTSAERSKTPFMP